MPAANTLAGYLAPRTYSPNNNIANMGGGGGEIRTPGTLARRLVFKTSE